MSRNEKHGWLMTIIGAAAVVLACLGCGWAVHAYVYTWLQGFLG